MGKYEWKKPVEIISGSYSGQLAETNEANIGWLTFNKMKETSPALYIKLLERWCPYCNNAETYVKSLKKISKLAEEPFCKITLNAIEQNNLTNFTVRDLIKSLQAENISDGTLQRKALAILTCLGFLKKENLEYENKKKEKKIKQVYNLNKPRSIPSCYNELKDCHKLDWEKEAKETNYFWKNEKNN